MAIRRGNFPHRSPFPSAPTFGAYGGSRFAKIIVAADTLLVGDSDDEFVYNLLLNDSADADTDLNIPCFIFPNGTMIEDIGVENFMVHTESAAYILGDTLSSAGWVSTLAFVATNTDAIGAINWMAAGLSARMFATTGSDDPALLSTLTVPAYVGFGPRAVYGSTEYSTVAVVGLASDDEPELHEYAIHIHQKGAVDVLGALAIYVKYNFSPLQIREPSTNLGLSTGA
jgi:hypothetical protein